MQQNNSMTVTQLTGLIKGLLENSFKSVTIQGEISNFRPNSSTGHLYFSLKDDNAQISACMWRSKTSGLKFQPKDGMKVKATGYISVYGPQGKYQLVINEMTVFGDGDIMAMILERKNRLAAEGLFNSDRKRRLPFFPKCIGVVTSSNGAALRDIINITTRRNPKVSIVVLPAIVQGNSASETITHMIETANKFHLCDVLIVGRGGGSLEDLLPFSDESVVRAVAASEIPVISAVGHEIDWALCDYAADVRAPTPSAAAELAVPELNKLQDRITDSSRQLVQGINERLDKLRLMIRQFTPEEMERQFRTIEQPYTMRYEHAREMLEQNMKDRLEKTKQRINEKRQVIEACSPQTIFDRGYSMVTDTATGKIIRSGSDVSSGTRITVRPAKGVIEATVN